MVGAMVGATVSAMEGAVEYRLPPHRTVERFLGFPTHKQPESDVAQHLPEESDANQDPSFYSVIEEYVQRQARSDRGLAVPTPAAIATVADALDSDEREANTLDDATPASPSLRKQAEQLRSQHQIAIRQLQQTRRQLELLKQIIVQQQTHWAQAADALAREREQWQTDRVQQQADWEHQRDEWQRLHTLEQNESTKRETFLDHREIAIRQLEERLQQAQVEILRDRVVLKQLERTARQSLSNLDWNQRWKVISEETQSYLRKVQDEAAQLQSETQRQMERLESRKAELLLYRESLRAWLERQMKLLARRTAHTNDRENQVQQAWDELEVTRQGVLHQHERLDQMLSHGLRNIDARLAIDPLAPPRADAA
jgi:chromosome segregation ATPase